jgi:ubiquinone biosynthesis monooxygenase Coq7
MIDRIVVEVDKVLRTLFAPAPTVRPIPGGDETDDELDAAGRRRSAALMRVNHCGEICAQALYQGQALSSRDPSIRRALEQAAWEETEHLHWTERRIAELGGRKSLLNPLWYCGALSIGVLAGKFGDGWNLGFLAETERQVEGHLQGHLARLPAADRRSWAILEQMKLDEIRHADTARRLGALDLPEPVRLTMKMSSMVMTSVAYYV